MCGSFNGVVENFALGVDKATFYPLEGKDFMDPQYLSEEVDHSWFTYPDGQKLSSSYRRCYRS